MELRIDRFYDLRDFFDQFVKIDRSTACNHEEF